MLGESACNGVDWLSLGGLENKLNTTKPNFPFSRPEMPRSPRNYARNFLANWAPCNLALLSWTLKSLPFYFFWSSSVLPLHTKLCCLPFRRFLLNFSVFLTWSVSFCLKNINSLSEQCLKSTCIVTDKFKLAQFSAPRLILSKWKCFSII